MLPEVWLGLVAGFIGIYLFILGWNVLAAASSYMERTRQRRFPLARCILAAAGPSAVPVVLFTVLLWWGVNDDAAGLVFVVTWFLSFWVSGRIERWLPESRAEESGEVEVSSCDLPRTDARSNLSNAYALLVMIVGVIKAWVALALGVALGYGFGDAVARWAGWHVPPPSWSRLAEGGPFSVLVFYGMMGLGIEILRFQGAPGDRPGLAGWTAARTLRFRLLASLAVMAVGVGLYARFWW